VHSFHTYGTPVAPGDEEVVARTPVYPRPS
jgi:hypothetical protein